MMVIFFTLLSVFKNSPDTIGFKRTIPLDTIKKSFLLFFVAISWVLIITMVMYSLENAIDDENNVRSDLRIRDSRTFHRHHTETYAA